MRARSPSGCASFLKWTHFLVTYLKVDAAFKGCQFDPESMSHEPIFFDELSFYLKD
jgi:hypothetical protein